MDLSPVKLGGAGNHRHLALDVRVDGTDGGAALGVMSQGELHALGLACTWLIRLALEHALDDFWQRRRPEVVDVSRRAQLLALTRTVDADLGLRCTQLWHALSRAAHHHAYELSPTSAELRGWHRNVYEVAAGLATR